MVLGTDMSTHFGDLAKVKGRLATSGSIQINLEMYFRSYSDFDIKEKDKNCCMETLLHAADISNPVKPFEVYFMWTERVLQEFFQQVSIIFH